MTDYKPNDWFQAPRQFAMPLVKGIEGTTAFSQRSDKHPSQVHTTVLYTLCKHPSIACISERYLVGAVLVPREPLPGWWGLTVCIVLLPAILQQHNQLCTENNIVVRDTSSMCT